MADEVLKITMSGRIYYAAILLLSLLITIVLSFIPLLDPLIFVVWIAAAICIMVTYVYVHSHWIEFSDEGINARVGLLNIKTLYMPYQNVDNIGMNITLIEKIAGLAEITIDSKGRAGTELVMKDLPQEGVKKAVGLVKEKIMPKGKSSN